MSPKVKHSSLLRHKKGLLNYVLMTGKIFGVMIFSQPALIKAHNFGAITFRQRAVSSIHTISISMRIKEICRGREQCF
jgi:hypothetical protein